jgi:hypothetical protein
MSFGFSAADIIGAVQLSWSVYRACKGSAKEFQEIAREVKYIIIPCYLRLSLLMMA